MIRALIQTLILKLKNKKKFNNFLQKYKAKNSHNFTFPINIFNLDNVSIGKSSYGPICVFDYGNVDAKVKIGNFCSIASGVIFLSGGGIA